MTEDAKNEEVESTEETSTPKRRQIVTGGKPEFWVYVAGAFLVATVACWAVVFSKLGPPSIVAHTMVAPTIGALTVAIMMWGLVTAFFRPPALQKPRVVGFLTLLVVGYFNNVPLFAPPLSTTQWEGPTAQIPLAEAYVTAGGDDSKTNYHATTAAYRWGTDFTVTKDGKKFALDGKKNTDYFCFGQSVNAPVSGRVVDVRTDIADNLPGEIRPEFDHVFGNHVVIEFGENAYAFIAQLQFQSVSVNIGDEVTPATEIGKCGNSGRSIEPHVHVHAQNSKNFPYSESLPLRYSFSENGKRIESAFPIGETTWGAGDGAAITRN